MIRVSLEKKINGVLMRSGHAYVFKYGPWRNDPAPTIIFMYAFSGTNPTTGHEWRFIQGINMTYLPREMRKAFANDWVKQYERTRGNVKFTWRLVTQMYPFMKFAVRRYFYSPTYYIKDLREVPFEKFESVVVSTYSKDFSKKVKAALLQKFRSSMKGRKEIKKRARMFTV